MTLQTPTRRAIGILAALPILTCFATAEAAGHFGNTTAGPSISGPLRANFKRASAFTLNQAGTLTQLCAYLDGNGGGGGAWQDVSLDLYSDAGGVPGQLVATTWSERLPPGMAPRWICSTTPLMPLSPGRYWIALHSGAYEKVLRYYYGPEPNWYGNADSYLDGASSAFGPGGVGDGTLSVYASVVGPAEYAHAGRLTVGTTPSGPLRANFKRGSSFQLTRSGTLRAVTLYMDGVAPNGQYGIQPLRYALYKDSNGTPGAKIAEGEDWIETGKIPRWISYGMPGVSIQPGRYWIILHTGEPAGVARYYHDGVGNWFGNADYYQDGATNPFGPGGAGDGTISAYISYKPDP